MNNLSFGQALKSRTVWAAIGAAALNIWNLTSGAGVLPAGVVEVGNAGLALLTAIFRIFPKQQPQQ